MNSLIGGIIFMSCGAFCGAIYRHYKEVEFEERDYVSVKMFAIRTLATVIMVIPLGLICGFFFLIDAHFLLILYGAISLPVFLGSFGIFSGVIEFIEGKLMCIK